MGHFGRGQAQGNFGGVPDTRQALELGAPRLQLVAILGKSEQPARIALGDSGALHRGASCASLSSKPRSRRAWSSSLKLFTISSRATRPVASASSARTWRWAASVIA